MHPACPSPTCPKRMGSSAKTHSQHLPPALGRQRAARRGREAALTWHTKPPYTSGGRRHSEVRGPPRRPARQREIPVAAEPRTYPPQAAFSPPPAAPRAQRWRRLGARGLAAGAGRAWWRPGAGDLRAAQGGRSPRRGGDSPTGRGAASRSPSRPARLSPPPAPPARPPARPESLYVNEAQLAVCSAHRPRKGGGRGGGPSGIHITQQQSGRLI